MCLLAPAHKVDPNCGPRLSADRREPMRSAALIIADLITARAVTCELVRMRLQFCDVGSSDVIGWELGCH